MRRDWFERYQYLDREGTVKEAERLESLLQRTRRALELQKRADEEYGLISDIRAKLMEIDLSLNDIDAVHRGFPGGSQGSGEGEGGPPERKEPIAEAAWNLKIIGSRQTGGGVAGSGWNAERHQIAQEDSFELRSVTA